jgi:DNA-binding Lrp family transcriptional regulator
VVHAYILVQTEVGRISTVATAISAIPGVVSAEEAIGPYDVIVRAEAPDMEQLGRMVIAQVQAIDGITRTLTCSVVSA